MTTSQPPIACSLDETTHRSRAYEWERLFELGLLAFRLTQNGILATFRIQPEIEAGLRELAAREAECCGFADWSVSADGDALELEVSAPADAVPVVHHLFRSSLKAGRPIESQIDATNPELPCVVGGGASVDAVPQRGRVARAAFGFTAIGLGGALATRRLPGQIALWPLAIVPSWFGISHLIAAMIGYDGCPELGAIPTVLHGQPIGSRCRLWERIDRRIGARADR